MLCGIATWYLQYQDSQVLEQCLEIVAENSALLVQTAIKTIPMKVHSKLEYKLVERAF
jgi:hypothetical protein